MDRDRPQVPLRNVARLADLLAAQTAGRRLSMLMALANQFLAPPSESLWMLATVCEGKTLNFLQGTLDILILTALSRGPQHGYDVVEWIRTTTDGTLQIEDGALYTSLHRLEQRGWSEAEWKTSPKGRKAKYYRLTAEGRRQLRSGERRWAQFAAAVAKVFAAHGRVS